MKIIVCFFFFTSPLWAQQAGQLVTAGDALDKENRNQEALSLYLRADAQKPNDAEIQWRLSKQYTQLIGGRQERIRKRRLSQLALESAQRAVSLDSTNAQGDLSLAIVYGRIALNESARRKVEMSRLIRQEAETAARLDPRNDYAWHVLGRWNYEIANFNPILKALAQTVYGKLPEASNEKAIACFSKAIALQPRRVSHHVELGRAYVALGEKQKARDEFNKALSLPSVEKDDDENKLHARAMLQGLQ